jgi:hypothetical protein
MMGATLANVSTLLMSVGQPHKPDAAGNGDTGDESRFLAANERAGAQPDVHGEAM